MKIWKREIAVALLFNFVTLCVLPAQSAAQSDPCTESTGKRVKRNAIVGAFAGAVLGAVVAKNNTGKAAAEGAGIGAGLGLVASIKKPATCSHSRETVKSPYNATIADANAPQTSASDGPGVLLRTVNGANSGTLTPILVQALPNRHYGFVDEALYRQNSQSIRVKYYLDVTVTLQGGIQGASGGGFARSAFSSWGDQAIAGNSYLVSVNMIDTETGRPDPQRSGIMSVGVATYASQNGYYTIANIANYGSSTFWSNDPQTAAAIMAINCFFRPIQVQTQPTLQTTAMQEVSE